MEDDAPVTPSLERRIRRHVHAPEHAWFAACAPGLEGVLAAEMAALGLEGVEPGPGGVAFRGKLEAGYRANLWLRTASRVLLRVARFRARSPEDLVRHARALPWEALLPPLPLHVQVSTAGSRLSGEGRIEDALRAAIRQHLAAEGLPVPERADTAAGDDDAGAAVQRLAVRVREDAATISLDSTGDLLHRRGWRLEPGPAPLRETLAAGLLALAGYEGGPLADPMCGSGTLPIEAALQARGLAPGAGRAFRFQDWPSYRPATWGHLLRKAADAAQPRAPHPIHARDLDPGTLAAARSNAVRAGVADDLVFGNADFFQAPAPAGPPGLVVLNPPYGIRIGADGGPAAQASRVGRRLADAWAGWRFAIVLPDPALVQALRLPVRSCPALPHGGLTVWIATGRC